MTGDRLNEISERAKKANAPHECEGICPPWLG